MKLTNRILEAIVDMSNRVEAGTVEDYQSYDGKEQRKAFYDAGVDGIWASSVMLKRERKRREKCHAKKQANQ